jgi:hypothetical protein
MRQVVAFALTLGRFSRPFGNVIAVIILMAFAAPTAFSQEAASLVGRVTDAVDWLYRAPR